LLFIYSGDRHQAVWLASWLGLGIHDWAYIEDSHTLETHPRNDARVIRFGSYHGRQDYPEMMDRFAAIGAFILDVNDDIMRYAHFRR